MQLLFLLLLLSRAIRSFHAQCTDDNSMIFLNEFHITNDGVDVNEFVEFVAPSMMDIGRFAIVLYDENGNMYSGMEDGTIQMGETVGATTFYFQEYMTDGISNEPGASIALLLDGSVVEFLAYGVAGGAMGPVALDGPAADESPIGIGGVGESSNSGENASTRRFGGPGCVCGDFTLQLQEILSSPGQVNTLQSFNCPTSMPTVSPAPSMSPQPTMASTRSKGGKKSGKGGGKKSSSGKKSSGEKSTSAGKKSSSGKKSGKRFLMEEYYDEK